MRYYDSASAKNNGLKGKRTGTRFSTFYSNDTIIKIQEILFKIMALDGRTAFHLIGCYTVPKLDLKRRNVDKRTYNNGYLVSRTVAEPGYGAVCLHA